MDSPTRPNAFHAGYDIVNDYFYVSASFRDVYSDRLFIAKPVELVERDRNTAERIGPLLLLDTQGMQSLMNALWGAGFRPKEVGTAGQLAAVERHLSDMRAIAFDRIKVEAPPMPQTNGGFGG